MPSATQTLDSRFLRVGDCFAHRFSNPGTFRYALSPLPSSLAAHHDEPPRLAVVVAAGGPVDRSASSDPAASGAAAGGERRTHTVTVSSSAGTLDASPAVIEVTAGDLVLWSPDRSVTFGFRVRGQLGEEIVDSAALRTESVFSHAFGLPGTYEWADANGSGLHGRVDVVSPPALGVDDVERWLGTLQQGTLVHITGERANPEAVQIVLGQTVVWAVEGAPGVTVTDRTLLPGKPAVSGSGSGSGRAVSPRRGRRLR